MGRGRGVTGALNAVRMHSRCWFVLVRPARLLPTLYVHARRDRCEAAETAAEEAAHRLRRAEGMQRRAQEKTAAEVESLRDALRDARARARSLQAELDSLRRGRSPAGPSQTRAMSSTRAPGPSRGTSPSLRGRGAEASRGGLRGRAAPEGRSAAHAGASRGPSPGASRAGSRERSAVPRSEFRGAPAGPRDDVLDRIRSRDRPWASRSPSVGSRSGASTPTRVSDSMTARASKCGPRFCASIPPVPWPPGLYGPPFRPPIIHSPSPSKGTDALIILTSQLKH